jgi:ribosomal protein S18 acetylase RimI-like enzyme
MTTPSDQRTGAPVVIRDAASDDREWAAQVMATSDPWLTLGRNEAGCRMVLHNPDAIVFVAWIGDARAGFVLCHRRGVVGSPYLATIAVEDAWRGRGVGSALIAFVEDYFRPDARHLFLCVSSFNPRARALYERLGFTQVGELPAYFIPTASEILMHKRLRG